MTELDPSQLLPGSGVQPGSPDAEVLNQQLSRLSRELGFEWETGETERFLDYEARNIEQAQLLPEREWLAKAITPEQVVWAMREFMDNAYEQSIVSPLYTDRYAQLSIYWQAVRKVQALEIGSEENKDVMGYLGYEKVGVVSHKMVPELKLHETSLIEMTDDMDLKDRKYAERQNKLVDARNTIIRQDMENNRKLVEFAESQRGELVDTLETEIRIFAAKAKVIREHEQYEALGGDLPSIAGTFIQPPSAFLNPLDFEALFNAGPKLLPPKEGPALAVFKEKFKERAEAREWSVDFDRAMRAYFIVGLCEKPELLKWYMKTPGWKLLFENEKQEKEFVGDVSKWTDRKQINNKGPLVRIRSKEDEGVDDLKREVKLGYRGKLTGIGNTWSQKEIYAQRQALRDAVAEFVGGNKSAETTAYMIFRMSAMAARFGSDVYYLPDKKKYQFEVEGWPAGSDDLVKVTVTSDWQNKDSASGHPIGPKYTRGKLDKLLVDFFTFSSSEVSSPNFDDLRTPPDKSAPKGRKIEVFQDKRNKSVFYYVTEGVNTAPADSRNLNRLTIRRSALEQWWGYPEEKGKPAEMAKRLGQINWRAFPPELWRDLKLRLFFAGREGKSGKSSGFLHKWTTVSWRPDELMEMEFWEQCNKDLNIIVGPTLVTDGKLREWDGWESELDDLVTQRKKDIKKLFSDGIMNTRENQMWINDKGLISGESVYTSIGKAQYEAGY